tara:strand:+ start:658 stop:798 length:141 start_codon:yes stop_codon:yes gene_type:complete
MKEIQFTLTVPEANAVMQALGQMPFVQVADLIAKLKKQAEEQLNAE